MNIVTSSNQVSANTTSNTNTQKSTNESSANFKQELGELEQSKAEKVVSEEKSDATDKNSLVNDNNTITNNEKQDVTENLTNKINNALNGLQNTVEEINNNKKDENNIAKDTNLINNDMNIPDPFMPNLEAGMNFNSNGQPFSAFVQQQERQQLGNSEKDLMEESAILSTMEENIAMVNRARIKNSTSIIDSQNSKVINIDEAIPSDSIIMNKSDVDFFANLVNTSEIEISEVQNSQKTVQISKTLADLLAKAMNENKPVRIDFDNDISVIIRISKDGKISVDFLPSSQIAEAYLKENLPLLKQKFDENNIDYDELNQRKQQRHNEKDEKKKGRENE